MWCIIATNKQDGNLPQFPPLLCSSSPDPAAAQPHEQREEEAVGKIYTRPSLRMLLGDITESRWGLVELRIGKNMRLHVVT